jgi:hypothetical protein
MGIDLARQCSAVDDAFLLIDPIGHQPGDQYPDDGKQPDEKADPEHAYRLAAGRICGRSVKMIATSPDSEPIKKHQRTRSAADTIHSAVT